MKNKKLLLYPIFYLLGLNLLAIENRAENFECINLYNHQIVADVKDILTADEAVETLKDVVYLLETSYVDFDEVEKRGFNRENFLNDGEELFCRKSTIQNETLFDYICNSLEPYVNDSHFEIVTKNKENLIIDLRQNPGGNTEYFYKFFIDLFSTEGRVSVFDEISAAGVKEISSPLIEKQLSFYTPEEKAFKNFEKSGKKTEKYKGNIIFLTSKTSASCSELMIKCVQKESDNVYVVGTNSMGTLAFANLFLYVLKTSGLRMRVCQLKMNYDYCLEEGSGVIPDYVVSGNLEDAIRYLTKDKKIAREIAKTS